MNSLQLGLVLVASIWAAMNTLIAGYVAVNATRDRILTGYTDEGIQLSLAHRKIMYQNDWLPLKAGIAFVSLAFGGFLGFFFLGLRDRRLLVKVLSSEEDGN